MVKLAVSFGVVLDSLGKDLKDKHGHHGLSPGFRNEGALRGN